MTDKTQWPQVDLPFLVGAPLAKLHVGRRRKLRMKGWMEGCDNDAAPTNEKGKKMIRGPMTCKKMRRKRS